MTAPVLLSLDPHRFDAAIVDLDGTMVDTLGDFVAALNLMLAELLPGHPSMSTLDAAAVERMVGKGSEHLVRSTLKYVQASMENAQPAIDLIAKAYRYAPSAEHREGIAAFTEKRPPRFDRRAAELPTIDSLTHEKP